MEPVVVTATRSPLSRQDVAANISVITAEQLQQMPATTVAQALQYLPGLNVEMNGGPGSDAGTVRIQGSETRHVTIYQDGVPMNQLVNPRTDLSTLPLDAVERIEIYKGAASSAWGSALGGVINIITKNAETKGPYSAEAKVSYGTHQTFKSKALMRGSHDDLSCLLSYTHEQNDGFIEHTDYTLDGVLAKIDYRLNDDNRINLSLAHNRGQNADPILNWADFGDEPFWDDIERQHTYQRLLFESALTSDAILTLEGYHRQSEISIDDVFPNGRTPFLDYEERLWGSGARLDWRHWKNHTVVTGLDMNWGRFEWDPFVEPRRSETIGDWAAYASDTHTRGALTVNGGARYDNSQDYGSAFSPSLGIVYGFTGVDAAIRAQAAKGFAAPDYSWVHDPTYGNPDLRPEFAVNYQLGIEMEPIRWLRMELNLFQAKVRDLIRFDSDTQRFQNIEKVTRKGFEWALAADSTAGLAVSIGGSHTDVRNDLTDTVIDDIPRTQYNLSLIYSRGAMSSSLLGKYIDHNSSYAETQDKLFLFDFLFKLKLPTDKRKGGWTLFGAVHNIFNTDYLIRDVWPQPGRWGEMGIRFEYEF